MQPIIGEILKSKGKMSTNEFVSNLQARGVEVLFNQASTGNVSGISYSYHCVVMQGSKLGNGFKCSTIKNIINYEQASPSNLQFANRDITNLLNVRKGLPAIKC